MTAMTPDKVEAALGVLRGLRDEMKGLPHSLGYEYTHMAKVDEALATLTSALAERERDAARWLPIDSVPDASQVVLFCDARGNLWTQCANAWDMPECGLPASFWQPLPSPPAMKDTDHAR